MFKLNLVKPTMNINGDNVEDWVRVHLEAVTAIEKAEEALRACIPHGRNYPDGAGGARQAMAERREALRAMAAEITAMALVIYGED